MKMDAHQEKMIGWTYFIVGYFSNLVSKQKLEIISTLLSLFIFPLRKLFLILDSFELLKSYTWYICPLVFCNVLYSVDWDSWNLFSSIHCINLTQKQICTQLSIISVVHFNLFSYNLPWYNKGIVERDIYILQSSNSLGVGTYISI